jgi:ABC-type amino acid transport substrate-binding protein
MKKYLALTLAIVLCLALFVGCGSTKTEAGKTSATDVASPAAVSPAASASTGDDLYKQAAGKTYTVGTDTTFAPFEFEDAKGTRTGIDYQILNAIADKMGFKVTWNVLGFDAAVTALESGQVDAVMAGMSITDARKLKYDFSNSYYDSTEAVAVAADSKIASLDDLKGKTVAVKKGTTGAQYAEKIASDYSLNVVYVKDSATMYTYVTSGQAEACFEDYPIVQYEISLGHISCKVINQSSFSYPYGFASMKGKNPELIAAFNEGLKELKADGSYDKILGGYFGTK